jgi:methyl-accepting chemotaxis protein
MCFQYECSRDEEEKTRLRSELDTVFTSIAQIIADFSLVLIRNKAILDQLDIDLKEWRRYTNETIDLEDKLTEIDTTNTELADSMVATIEEVYIKAHARASKADEDAAELDAWVQGIIFILCVLAVILGAIVSWVLTMNITKGIKAAVAHMNKIGHEGDVSIDVPGFFMARRDEIGHVATAVHGIQEHFRGVQNLATSLANYDYSVQAQVSSDKDLMNINLNHMISEISDAVREINNNAKQVATGANEVSSASQNLSNGAQQMAASLEEITATMHEISGQTKTNAESAGQARDLAQASSKVAGEGQTVMHELIGAMERITKNSEEIQRVIKVVDDIAFQTNLLALNAAVEAARAGQHGKGFAVVAEEVRNLASRSAKAAQETAELIAKSSQEIQRGDEIAAHTSGVFDTIVEQIKQTTDLVAGIAIASNEQAQGVGQVSIGLHQIDGATQTNTASAEESASAANEMSSMAKRLQELVSRFRLRDR